MKKKILVYGLPGSGKTWLSSRLQKTMGCSWFNADKIREMANDWNFDKDARSREARRMRNIADYEKSVGHSVICDFVCPTKITREIYEADITIYMDTISEGRFEDTNKMFEKPAFGEPTIHITEFLSDAKIEELAQTLLDMEQNND